MAPTTVRPPGTPEIPSPVHTIPPPPYSTASRPPSYARQPPPIQSHASLQVRSEVESLRVLESHSGWPGRGVVMTVFGVCCGVLVAVALVGGIVVAVVVFGWEKGRR